MASANDAPALIQSRVPDDKELRFGEHKGKTVAYLFHERKADRYYVRWLAGYTGYGSEQEYSRFTGCRKIVPNTINDRERHLCVPELVKQEARALLRGKCLLCFGDTGEEWKTWCSACFREAAYSRF